MDDLFKSDSAAENGGGAISPNAPLAARFRPRTLDEYIGQGHLLASGKPLRRLIEADRLTSLILFGPPGVGKTSLAEVIARRTKCHFERLNGVEGTVADLRRVLAAAVTRMKSTGRRTVLFIDEIHRFNKAQQDVLLPDVEAGSVRLIGATTHNPSFYITGPLVSRSQSFQLEPLSTAEISTLINAALADPERGLGKLKVDLTAEARAHLIATSEGDARRALNGLEIAALTTPPDATGVAHIDVATIEECVQKKRVLYDKDEDQHYDTISAFIKSVRGSDPDSALYWLAKMIEAGEDPRFIARRLIILASEDIGLADPQGLVVAVSALHAVEFIGMPEGKYRWPKRRFISPAQRRATRPSVESEMPSMPCKREKSSQCRPICATPIILARNGSVTARATSTATIFPALSRRSVTASNRAVFSSRPTTATKRRSRRASLSGRSCGPVRRRKNLESAIKPNANRKVQRARNASYFEWQGSLLRRSPWPR